MQFLIRLKDEGRQTYEKNMYLVGGWTTHLNKLSQNFKNVFPFLPLTILVDVCFVVFCCFLDLDSVIQGHVKDRFFLKLNIKPWIQWVLLWLFFMWEKVYKHLRKCVAPIESAHPCELTSHIDFYIYFKTWLFWVHVYLPGSCWMSSILVVVCPPKTRSKLQSKQGSFRVPGLYINPLTHTHKKRTGVIILPTQTSCTMMREIPQIYHTFALFDPPQMGNLPHFTVGFHHPHLRLKVASAAWTANLKWTRSEPQWCANNLPYRHPVPPEVWCFWSPNT